MLFADLPHTMARTVRSEIERRMRRGTEEQKRDKGVEEKEQEGVVENNFDWEGGEGGENVGGLEGEEALGRGKRVRLRTRTFQFGGSHVLFSQTSATYKQKKVSEEKLKEKRVRFYRKRHFSELKNQIKGLKTVNKKLASKLKAQSKQIKTLKTKK